MKLILGFLAIGLLLLARDEPLAAQREKMVREQIERRGVSDPAVLRAMRQVPRHLFVSPGMRADAYDDRPLPIGHRATISQPFIVAWMTELLQPEPGDRVLEIGTGSGYQAAVLANLVRHVFTIEIVPELAGTARERLTSLGYGNITVRSGDGYQGWPEEAPFDGIILTAAPPETPQTLLRQLAPGGKLVAPLGPAHATQQLTVIEKTKDGRLRIRTVGAVTFVPMVPELK